MANLDSFDLKILKAIQADSSQSVGSMSDGVGLSANACWKRVKRLEEEGYVTRRVALLDRQKLGLNVTAFVTIRTDQHEEKWLEDFAATIRQIPEVVEFYRMSGQVDYMLKIVCSDIGDYDRIYKKLIRTTTLRDVSAFFAMEQIKYTTEIPIEVLSTEQW